MFKFLGVSLVLVMLVLGFASCGGSPNGTVCSSLLDKIYAACDPSKPADAQIIAAAITGLGQPITAAEVAAGSKSSFEKQCEDGLKQVTPPITGAQADAFQTAVKSVPTTDCQTTVTILTSSLVF